MLKITARSGYFGVCYFAAGTFESAMFARGSLATSSECVATANIHACYFIARFLVSVDNANMH